MPELRPMIMLIQRPALNLTGILTAAFLLLLASRSQAQTYFYLEQITVAPTSPTTSDAIMISVSGNLSSTAAYIVNTGVTLDGNTVQISVNAAVDGIGLDVLVPHTEYIPIGYLAAGTYTININGASIADLAPSPEHQFEVSGGSPTDCDSLDVISAQWGTFSNGTIVLTVANASSDLFDYPGFVLLDLDGDTLAKETVNYFGIGQGPQEHILNVVPGAAIGQGVLNAQLHLWSGFFSEPECQWEVSWDLCPPQECVQVMPYLWNLGDAIVTVTCPYTLENEDGVELAAGIFNLNINDQNAYGAEACLPPGNYTLRLDQVGFVGGQLYYGMTTSMANSEQIQEPYVQGTAENFRGFTVLEECIDGSNDIVSRAFRSRIQAIVVGDELFISTPDGSGIGSFRVLDVEARVLRAGTIIADRGRIPLHGMAFGAYLFANEHHVPVRFIR